MKMKTFALGAIVATIPARNAWRVVIFEGVLFLLGAILALVFARYHWDWRWFGAIVGAVLGLIAGDVVLVNVSARKQLFAAGTITGMGVDWLTTFTQTDGPKTAIHSLAKLVSNTVAAAASEGLPSPALQPFTYGLWAFFGALALVMLLGAATGKST